MIRSARTGPILQDSDATWIRNTSRGRAAAGDGGSPMVSSDTQPYKSSDRFHRVRIFRMASGTPPAVGGVAETTVPTRSQSSYRTIRTTRRSVTMNGRSRCSYIASTLGTESRSMSEAYRYSSQLRDRNLQKRVLLDTLSLFGSVVSVHGGGFHGYRTLRRRL